MLRAKGDRSDDDATIPPTSPRSKIETGCGHGGEEEEKAEEGGECYRQLGNGRREREGDHVLLSLLLRNYKNVRSKTKWRRRGFK